jgi:uncharacterized surface protein with fasciclin (FAS1) repeats
MKSILEIQMQNFSRRKAIATSAVAICASLVTKPGFAQTDASTPDALTLMTSDPQFSDWVQILNYTGLTQYAGGADKFTAFIPTNTAFKKDPSVIEAVLRSKSRAFPDTSTQVEFVRSHVIRDIHPLSELSGKNTMLTSIAGLPIHIDGRQAGVYIVSWTSVNSRMATIRVTDKPLVASNAIIYPFSDLTLS